MADAELDELKREFLAEALEKVDEIQANVTGQRSRESLDRLIYLAHQLKGSGGSYGFQRISTDAAELEKAVERVVKGEGNETVDAQILQYASSLRDEIESRTRELATV